MGKVLSISFLIFIMLWSMIGFGFEIIQIFSLLALSISIISIWLSKQADIRHKKISKNMFESIIYIQYLMSGNRAGLSSYILSTAATTDTLIISLFRTLFPNDESAKKAFIANREEIKGAYTDPITIQKLINDDTKSFNELYGELVYNYEKEILEIKKTKISK